MKKLTKEEISDAMVNSVIQMTHGYFESDNSNHKIDRMMWAATIIGFTLAMIWVGYSKIVQHV